MRRQQYFSLPDQRPACASSRGFPRLPNKALLRTRVTRVRRPRRRVFGTGVAGTLALTIQGCSLAFTTRPPADAERMPPEPPLDCSTSVAPPVIDTIIATYQAVRVGVGLASDDSAYRRQPLPRQADIAIGAGLLAVFTASAVWGYTQSSIDPWHEAPLADGGVLAPRSFDPDLLASTHPVLDDQLFERLELARARGDRRDATRPSDRQHDPSIHERERAQPASSALAPQSRGFGVSSRRGR